MFIARKVKMIGAILQRLCTFNKSLLDDTKCTEFSYGENILKDFIADICGLYSILTYLIYSKK